MRLYHYLCAKYAKDNLKKGRLKISQLDKTNDSFDLELIAYDNQVEERRFRPALNDIKKDFGCICFSENCGNPSMWDRYADNYKGLCLGFDIDDKLLKKVNYENRRRNIMEFPHIYEYIRQCNPNNFDHNHQNEMLMILRSKSRIWEHEKEWRVWNRLNKSETHPVAGELYFFDFDKRCGKQMVLREILVGFRCPDQKGMQSDLDKLVADYYPKPEISFTRPSLSAFEIEKAT